MHLSKNDEGMFTVMCIMDEQAEYGPNACNPEENLTNNDENRPGTPALWVSQDLEQLILDLDKYLATLDSDDSNFQQVSEFRVQAQRIKSLF